MSLELIIGLGIASWLFLYFAFQLSRDDKGNEQHFILKLLLVFFFIYTLTLIPKAALDARTQCTPVISSTEDDAPYTNYTYTEECVTTSNTTEVTFLKTILWFFRLFAIYFFIFLTWHWMQSSQRMMKIANKVKRSWVGRKD